MSKFRDLAGQKFGRLIVIKRAPDKCQGAYWLCRCDCGKSKTVRSSSLISGNTQSCGCLGLEMLGKYRNQVSKAELAKRGVAKTCSRCKKTKPISEYYKQVNKLGGYSYLCKDCSRQVTKKSRQKHIEKRRADDLIKKKKGYEKAKDYLGGKCKVCGSLYESCNMVFHHRDPSVKSGHVSSMLKGSWKVLKKELDKCDFLCVLCHNRIHAGEDG